MLFFFGAGVLLAFTACMYPMIPIISSIIVGHGENITVGKAFSLTLIYVEAAEGDATARASIWPRDSRSTTATISWRWSSDC